MHIQSRQNGQFEISPDGYIRVPASTLETIRLSHLDSGLYSSGQIADQDGCMCNISGYTEWVTDTEPSVSIGWDWNMVTHSRKPDFIATGGFYSNLMVQSEWKDDLSEKETEKLFTQALKELNWQAKVRSFITEKYA